MRGLKDEKNSRPMNLKYAYPYLYTYDPYVLNRVVKLKIKNRNAKPKISKSTTGINDEMKFNEIICEKRE